MMEEILRVVEEQADTIMRQEGTICRLVRLLIETGATQEQIEEIIKPKEEPEPEEKPAPFFGERRE